MFHAANQHTSHTNLFSVPVFCGSFADAFGLISRALEKPAGSIYAVVTPNTEHIMLAQRDHGFLHTLQSADLALPDGFGVVRAARMLNREAREQGTKQSVRERIAGREMVTALLEHCAARGFRVFFLGGKPGVVQEAVRVLRKTYPTLRVAGSEGARDIRAETPEEYSRVLEEIRAFHPQLLCVAYGAPHQETWMMKQREELQWAGVRVVVAIGGTLDILAGRLKPAPPAVSRAGFEWLWRLIQEPWRIKRQTALLFFWKKVFTTAVQEKLQKK